MIRSWLEARVELLRNGLRVQAGSRWTDEIKGRRRSMEVAQDR